MNNGRWVTISGRKVFIRTNEHPMNAFIKNNFKKPEIPEGHKRVRINSQYGNWYYRKEVDYEDPRNYMYYIGGTDANGKEWSYMTPFYNEINDFIKADDEIKERMKNY